RRDRRQDPLPRRRADRQGRDRGHAARCGRGDGRAGARMIRFAIRGLGGRRLRSVLTAFAIVLGVATVSGTFVLTDSISSAFDKIFTSIYRGTDASITGRSAISHDQSHQADLPPFNESLLGKVRALP